MIKSILTESWHYYRKYFGLISLVVITIWLPLELLTSYVDKYVFSPEDIRRSIRFSMLIENVFGIIATAGVISILYNAYNGKIPCYRSAISAGFSSWKRLFWARFVSGIVILLGFLALIVPGIYLYIRLSLIESIAVCEHLTGSDALKRSFALTKGHFWNIFLLMLSFGMPLIAACIAIVLPSVLIPSFDHWLIDAFTSLALDVITAFETICMFITYAVFSKQKQNQYSIIFQ